MSLQLLTVNQQDFESGTTGWAANVNCAIAQTAAQAHTGTKSLSLTSSAGGDMSAITPATSVPVMPGRSYTLSAWFRTAVSVRTCHIDLYWFQADSTTGSALTANNNGNSISDSTSAWTQSTVTATAPADAYYVKVVATVLAAGAGAEVHYLDTVSLLDNGSPYFKQGRTGEIWFNGVDVSPYFASSAFHVQMSSAEVTTFKSTWRSFLLGDGIATLQASGYYDSADADKVRDSLQAAVGQATFFPAGATAIGDQGRLLNVNSAEYVNGDRTGDAVSMNWTAQSTAPVGFGSCLHILQQETGTVNGTGDGLLTQAQSTTGLVAHLHVTALSGGTLQFKLQDATAINGAYADIASGAFVNVTAVGSQRLVVPGTIRAFVRAVATLGANTCTYGIAAART